MIPEDLVRLAGEVLETCRRNGVSLAVAESCTGGLIAGSLTAVPGSSDVFDRGFVTYTNHAKSEMLGIPDSLIAKHGAVSEETARAMAEGVLSRSTAQVSVAVTGIAGPGGATPAKPVGLIHIAAASLGRPTLHETHSFAGDRAAVREQAVRAALSLILQQLGNSIASSSGGASVRGTLGGRDVALVFFGVLVCLGLSVAGAAGLAMIDPALRDALTTPSLPMVIVTVLGQTLILSGCVYGLAIRRRGLPWAAIGFRPTTRYWAVIAVALGVTLVFVLEAIDDVVKSPVSRMAMETIAPDGFSWGGMASMIVVAGGIAPVAEEMLFRGVLYNWVRRRWGVSVGVIASSAAFGIAHINPYWAMYVAVVGVVLAVIYEKSGSLWPPIFLHMSYNATSVITLYLSIR